jgi:hypothetical protein
MVVLSTLTVAIVVLYAVKYVLGAAGYNKEKELVSEVIRKMKRTVQHALKIKRKRDGPRHNDVQGNEKK